MADHQNVDVLSSFQSMVDVDETDVMATRGGGEYWTQNASPSTVLCELGQLQSLEDVVVGITRGSRVHFEVLQMTLWNEELDLSGNRSFDCKQHLSHCLLVRGSPFQVPNTQ